MSRHLLRRGWLRLRDVLRRTPLVARPTLGAVTVTPEGITFQGRVATRHAPEGLELVLRRFRDETRAQAVPLTCRPARTGPVARLMGRRAWDFTAQVDLDWAATAPGLFALDIAVGTGGRRMFFRAGPGVETLYPAGETRTLCVFTEASVGVLRIEAHAIGPADVMVLRQRAQEPQDRPACVIGEYTNTARDNGIALFRALREVPDIAATYVIEAENADGLPLGEDVVAWGSRAHLDACLDARLCAFTHHRTYVYPAILRAIAPDRYAAAWTLFLQHGVMAMKGGSVVSHYHRTRVDYDAVLVSSARERGIFTRDFGYPAPRVHVTGLPRLDRLYTRAKDTEPDPNRVLVAPTWRPGLEKLPSERIADHPYFTAWRAALAALRAAGLTPVLIGHPILRRHLGLFGARADEIRGNTDFQDTLLSASALVTDRSSTAWDALYAGRPVFLLRSEGAQDGFIPDSALPGPVTTTATALAETVAAARAAGWPFTADRPRDLAFDRIDAANSARVIALIRRMLA